MATLDNVKTILSITDDKQDKLLQVLIDNTEKRLLSLLPATETVVPSGLSFIVDEVTVKRYNRIGAEGMQSESVEGRSSTYRDDDFSEYLSTIERYYPKQSTTKRGLGVFY